MSKGFYRFLFWVNIVGLTDFFVRVIIIRQHRPDIDFILAFVNTIFTWKVVWPHCEYDTTWWTHFVRHLKWRYLKWKHKK